MIVVPEVRVKVFDESLTLNSWFFPSIPHGARSSTFDMGKIGRASCRERVFRAV